MFAAKFEDKKNRKRKDCSYNNFVTDNSNGSILQAQCENEREREREWKNSFHLSLSSFIEWKIRRIPSPIFGQIAREICEIQKAKYLTLYIYFPFSLRHCFRLKSFSFFPGPNKMKSKQCKCSTSILSVFFLGKKISFSSASQIRPAAIEP